MKLSNVFYVSVSTGMCLGIWLSIMFIGKKANLDLFDYIVVSLCFGGIGIFNWFYLLYKLKLEWNRRLVVLNPFTDWFNRDTSILPSTVPPECLNCTRTDCKDCPMVPNKNHLR